MSHFPVTVLCKDSEQIDAKLEPFQEEVTEDSPYARFMDTTSEVLDGWKALDGEIGGKEREAQEAVGTLHKYKDIEEYALDYHGYTKHEDKYGYITNPDAKWDWYVVGGRWSSLLLLKGKGLGEYGEGSGILSRPTPTDPMRADIAKIKDIDFEAIWAKQLADAEEGWTLAHRGYDVRKTDTKEIYMARHAGKYLTRAVLDLDNEWYEAGAMRWFGMSTESNKEMNEYIDGWMERFINPLDPETYIAIVDCHI